MPKIKNKKIIIFLLSSVLFFGLFQLAYTVTKNIGETATITVTCSDPDGNLSQCSVTSPCTKNCSASGYSGSCSCQFTCIIGGTYNACGTATDANGLTDSKCLDTVICNSPPTAAISCDPSECGTTDCIAYTSCPFHLINNSTDPNGQADIIKSEWDILNWGTDPDLNCTPPTALCNFTPQTAILTAGTYTVELYVQDSAGASDTETTTFYLKQEAIAGFMCSLDNLNWKTCEELRPFKGELVYLKDDPSLTEYSTPSEGATSITKRIWKLNDNVFNSDNNPNPSTNLNQTSNNIELTITDNLGRTDSVSHTILAQLPLPEWKEIAPF